MMLLAIVAASPVSGTAADKISTPLTWMLLTEVLDEPEIAIVAVRTVG
jgi:hypothetical protein